MDARADGRLVILHSTLMIVRTLPLRRGSVEISRNASTRGSRHMFYKDKAILRSGIYSNLIRHKWYVSVSTRYIPPQNAVKFRPDMAGF